MPRERYSIPLPLLSFFMTMSHCWGGGGSSLLSAIWSQHEQGRGGMKEGEVISC